MAWNEPGKGDKKDPWGTGGNQRPPDLDEVLKKLQKKIVDFFSTKGDVRSPNSTNSGGTDKFADKFSSAGLNVIVIILVLLYGVSGIYTVGPAEKAVIFQFGRYHSTVGSGPHWIARFFQSKLIVNVDAVSSSQHQAQMLTKDENIVSVELGVQYKINSIEDYLFNVRDPESTLEQVTDSAVRQIIGHSTLDDILTGGREQIRQLIKAEIIRILDQYQAGLQIVDVAMQPAKAPDAVKESFDDAIKAQEDEVREINQARTYEKQKVPIAEGQAQRRVLEAEAYKTNVVLQSEGDTSRFLKVLPEFERAPKVTRERLYLAAMESIYSNSSKIYVDSSGGNNMFYLPLDKLLKKNKPIVSSEDIRLLEKKLNPNPVRSPVDSVKTEAQISRNNRWSSNADPRIGENYSR